MWQWDRVAAQYAALIANEDIEPLGNDPFAKSPAEAANEVATASWKASEILLLGGDTYDFRTHGSPPGFEQGVYALYADVDVQVCCSKLRETLQRTFYCSQCL